jgi:hypothetical protein
MNYLVDTFGDDLLGQLKAETQNAPNIARFERIEARMSKIEKELDQMHALVNKLCPGIYGARPDLTIAEKFEKLLTEGPEWVEIKKQEKE